MYYTELWGGEGGEGGHYLRVRKSAPTKYKPFYLILMSPHVRLKIRSCAGKGQLIMSYTPLANTPALETLTLIKGVSSFLLKSFVYGANTGNMVT